MLVKLFWNLGTLILLVNVFHEKPKSKYFLFFNMRGCGRRSGEKAFVTRFVVAVAFLCPEVLGRGWALSCFVLFSLQRPFGVLASSFTRTEVIFFLIYLSLQKLQGCLEGGESMGCGRKALFEIGVLTWPVFKFMLLNQIIYTASVSAAAGLRIQAAPARPWEGLQPSFDTKVSGNADLIRFLGSVAFTSIAHLPVRELNRARFLAAFPKQLHLSLLITF